MASNWFMSTSASFLVLASISLACESSMKRRVESVSASSASLFGSTGGCPPLGDARVILAPASLKTKNGAVNSSSQKPVLWPVSPIWSCEVSTIRMFINSILLSGIVSELSGVTFKGLCRSIENSTVITVDHRLWMPTKTILSWRTDGILRKWMHYDRQHDASLSDLHAMADGFAAAGAAGHRDDRAA